MKLVVAIGLQPDGGRVPRYGAKVPGRVRDSVTRFTKDMAGRAPLEREGAGLESQGSSPLSPGGLPFPLTNRFRGES
jgi:hypothetical protein